MLTFKLLTSFIFMSFVITEWGIFVLQLDFVRREVHSHFYLNLERSLIPKPLILKTKEGVY